MSSQDAFDDLQSERRDRSVDARRRSLKRTPTPEALEGRQLLTAAPGVDPLPAVAAEVSKLAAPTPSATVKTPTAAQTVRNWGLTPQAQKANNWTQFEVTQRWTYQNPSLAPNASNPATPAPVATPNPTPSPTSTPTPAHAATPAPTEESPAPASNNANPSESPTAPTSIDDSTPTPMGAASEPAAETTAAPTSDPTPAPNPNPNPNPAPNPGANRPPVVSLPTERSLNEGESLTMYVQATDPDPGQLVSFHLGPNSPEGAKIDAVTGLLTWTAPSGPSEHNIQVEVTDSGAPSQLTTVNMKVTVNNLPPVIKLGGEGIAEAGQPFTRLASVTDPGGDAFTGTVDYDDGRGKQPLAVDPATGMLRLSTIYPTTGRRVITVEVTDKDGGQSTATFPVLVRAPGTNPVPGSPTNPANPAPGVPGNPQQPTPAPAPSPDVASRPPRIEATSLLVKRNAGRNAGTMVVRFDRPVEIGPGAFEVYNRRGAAIPVRVVPSLLNNKTIVNLIPVNPRAMVAAGAPRLIVHAGQITDDAGRMLDGNADGTPGDNFARFVRPGNTRLA